MEYSKTLNIFERLAAITAEMPEIEKDLVVEKNGKTYSALSESAVLKAVRPLEAKFHVYSYPVSRKKVEGTVEREYTYDGQIRKSTMFVDNVEVTYRFVNMDKPDEFIDTVAYGTGIDTGDKAPGKGMTYADKYALMKMYKICGGTAADPDSQASPDSTEEVTFKRDAENPMLLRLESSQPESKAKEQSSKAESKSESDHEPANEGNANIPATVEEAKAVILGIGAKKGKSFGEVLAIAPDLIRFYAGDKFNGSRYPEYKAAAKLLLPELG